MAASMLNPAPPNAARKFVQLRVDPTRGAALELEPARKKLTTLETQRVMGVLEGAIRRAELARALHRVCADVGAYATVLGRELVAAVEAHQPLRERWAELAAKSDVIDGRRTEAEETSATEMYAEDFWTRPRSAVSAKSHQSTESREELLGQREEIEAEMAELLPKLQYSLRCVLRGFRANPAAVTGVLAEGRAAHSGSGAAARAADALLDRLRELREFLVLRLMEKPAEKGEKMAYLYTVSEKEKANASVIEKLEQELKVETDNMDAQIAAHNDTIRKLQSDTHFYKKMAEENARKLKLHSEKEESTEMKNSEGRKQKLHQELTQNKIQLQNMIREHRESEQGLRRKKLKNETGVEHWIQKYDSDMSERQTEFEEVDEIYNEEQKQLQELEERFKTLEEEYDQIMEERRIAQEKREASEREMQIMIGAATCIQAFWRSFKVRKVLRGKKKKGGGKKGK